MPYKKTPRAGKVPKGAKPAPAKGRKPKMRQRGKMNKKKSGGGY